MSDTNTSRLPLGTPFWIALLAMIAVIVASNFLVTQQVPGLAGLLGMQEGSFNWAQFTFPIAFLITDIINRLFGAQFARLIAGVAFLVAVPLSILVNWDPDAAMFAVRIGLASGAAYIVGQLLDISIFQWLRQQAWWVGPFVGSVIASLIDTAIFYAIAFWGEPWVVDAGMIDFAVKVVVAIVALVPFRLVIAQVLSNRGVSQ